MRVASLLLLTACWSPSSPVLERWISQPPGYEMVGLRAVTGSRRQRMRGRITNPACGTFDVERAR